MAAPVLPAWAGRAARPATVRPAAPVHRGAGRRGQGAGLRAARRDRGAAVALELPGTGARGDAGAGSSRRSRRRRCAAGWPAMRSSPGSTGRGSSRATPTSPPRPGGCWTCTPASGTATPRRGRVRDLRRRETRIQARRRIHPSRAGPARTTADAGRARVPRRRAGLPGRLRRAPRQVFGRCEPTTGIVPFTGWSSRS